MTKKQWIALVLILGSIGGATARTDFQNRAIRRQIDAQTQEEVLNRLAGLRADMVSLGLIVAELSERPERPFPEIPVPVDPSTEIVALGANLEVRLGQIETRLAALDTSVGLTGSQCCQSRPAPPPRVKVYCTGQQDSTKVIPQPWPELYWWDNRPCRGCGPFPWEQ